MPNKAGSQMPGSATTNSTGPLFTFQQAQLSYESRIVLRDLDLTVYPGERIALIGKSGSGKSTLLQALRKQRPQQVAWCPQRTGLVPMLSVYHNIYMGGLQRHNTVYNLANLIKPFKQPLADVQELTEHLRLDEKLLVSIDQLSGGQQQRVAIGRALYQQQNIFLGDEPVSAVDDFQAEHLLSLISQRHDTLILALHDIDQALQVCDRIIGLKNNTIALDAPAASLCSERLAPLYQ
jgi:phosphonate transport system ATP-binding protein